MDAIVVVGGGLAGLRSAEQLRREGFDGDLTIVGDEPHRPYTRPPLSKQLLAGRRTEADCAFDCSGLDVTWRLGTAATDLDVHERIVRLADGAELGYDGLVIATGRRARELPGLPDLGGFSTLRSLDDCAALAQAVDEHTRVVIVGGGFIGCEVAATLRGRGVASVTIVETADQPMPPLGPEAGRRAAEIHAAHGVELRLGCAVEAFEGVERVEAVVLKGGERLDADVVLLAVGSVANTEWLAASGLELRHGAVVVDEHCLAGSMGDVVAAGDVAAWPHPQAPEPVCVEHWTHAAEMGRAAAHNLLVAPRARVPFTPVPTFWSDQYDLKIKSAGLFGLATETSVVHDQDGSLIVEGRRDGELVGAVLFNRNRSFIEYRRRLAQELAGAAPAVA